MSIMEGTGVSISFGGLKAVSDVKFNVEEGEILGLIGPNGAGKSTFFNLLSGALTMDSGTVYFCGKKISGLKPNQICHLGLGRTFQAAKNFPGMAVYQNVMMGALFGKKGRSAAEAAKITDEVLDFVGLTELKDKNVTDIPLSAQKQLEVARALATRPKLLLLDEVMAGLNPTEVEDAMKLILDLAVELPVYQRSTVYVYNANVINSETMPKASEMNPYTSPLDRIWEIEFAN